MVTVDATPPRLPMHLKSAVVRALTRTGVAKVFRPLMRGAAIVYMLHRFVHPHGPSSGDDPATVRRLLAYLRREKYNLLGLETLFRSLHGEGPALRHAVAFTIDDGYSEQAAIAGPLFAEFDCPVTTFVTTGFLDRALWMWWDKIEYVFHHTARAEVVIELEHSRAVYELQDSAARRVAQDDFTACCKTLRDDRKQEAIRELARVADVSLPETVPDAYAPMTWNQLRACEGHGMTFGPHTHTHLILTRTGDAEAREEIVQSWARLQVEARRPVPIFAYPNGQTGDYDHREFAVMRELGLLGAVTGTLAFATVRRYRAPDGPFLLPRFPFPDSLPYLIQQVSGLERLKFWLRGAG